VGGAATESAPAIAEYTVPAANAADLSARLAALLATGATLIEVTPARASLETRVEQALHDSHVAVPKEAD
jgi:hypothetical protein